MVNGAVNVPTEEEWPCLISVSFEISGSVNDVEDTKTDFQDPDQFQEKIIRIRLNVVSLKNDEDGYVDCLDRIIWRQDSNSDSDYNQPRIGIWSAVAAAAPPTDRRGEKSDYDKESYQKAQAQIRKDVGRTPLSDQVSINALERVLLSVAECIPEVGYCQGMNFIAAVGLDTGLEEESVCNLIVSFAQTVADGYWTEFLEGVCTDQLILEHLARTRSSDLCSHLDDMAVPLAVFSGPWLLQLYTNVLPRHVLKKVWDVLILCRGKWARKAIMMSLCLAILRFMSADILGNDDSSSLLAFVSTTMPMAAGELCDSTLVTSALAIFASGDCEPQKICELSAVYDMTSSSRDENAGIFNVSRTYTLMRYLLDREEYQRSLRNQVDELMAQGLHLKENDTPEILSSIEKSDSFDNSVAESSSSKESDRERDQRQEAAELERRLSGSETIRRQLVLNNDELKRKNHALIASNNALQEQLIRERKQHTEQTSALKAVLDAAQSMNRRISKDSQPAFTRSTSFHSQNSRREVTLNHTAAQMVSPQHPSTIASPNSEYAKMPSPKVPLAGFSNIEETRNENGKWSRNPFTEEGSRQHRMSDSYPSASAKNRQVGGTNRSPKLQASDRPFLYNKNTNTAPNSRTTIGTIQQNSQQPLPYHSNRTNLASRIPPVPARSVYNHQNKEDGTGINNNSQNREQGLKTSSFSGLEPDHPLFQLYKQRQRNRQ